jgi:hypothetical protein
VKQILKKLAALAMIAVGIGILTLSMSGTTNYAQKDFISYWAAGQLLAHHQDPYDAGAVFTLEKSAGFTEPQPLVMRNPPYALLLALPLGLLGPESGVIVWSLVIVGALMLAVRILWILHGRQPDRQHLLLYAFAPALSCMQLGQTSTFALLGLALFLYWHERKPFAAGLSLVLLFIKPHLLVAFGLVLLLWCLNTRAWQVLAGAASGLAAATAIAFWFDPHVASHYLPVLGTAGGETSLIPTLSSLVRAYVFRGAAWGQSLPAVMAALWGVWYFQKHRREWSWHSHGLLLLVVSLWAAPYSWFTDEILVAPALLRGIYRSTEHNRRMAIFGALDAVALILLACNLPLHTGVFVWTPTAWLAWYLWANRPVSEAVVAERPAVYSEA